MKIKLIGFSPEGKALPVGDDIEASTAEGLVELMRTSSPFAAAQSTAEYCRTVLVRVEGDRAAPLPDEPKEAAEVFLVRLEKGGRIAFLDY